MAKYKVEYTITGNYTIDSNAIIDPSDETGLTEIEEIQECVEQDPFCDCDPMEDGKVVIKVSLA